MYVVPLAIRYEFTGDYKPQIFVKFGKIETINSDDKFKPKLVTEHFENCLNDTLQGLKIAIICNTVNNYERLF